MNLLILAAGYATRLGAVARSRPKALLDVAGRPSLDRLLDGFAGIPIDRTVVVSNHRFAGAFEAWAADRPGCPVEIVDDRTAGPEDRLGAIGDLEFAIREAELGDDDLVVAAGDNLFDTPLDDWESRAARHEIVIATVDLGSPEAIRRFASVETDREGRILGLVEKPEAPTTTVAGIALYRFRRSALPEIAAYLRSGGAADNAGFLFEWLHPRRPTHAVPVEGAWFDIGDVATLDGARRFFASREESGGTGGWNAAEWDR